MRRLVRFVRSVLFTAIMVMVTALASLSGAEQAAHSFRPADDSRATDLVHSYNLRKTGSPAWRRVSVLLRSAGSVTRTYTISNFWRTRGDISRTLFFLEEPEGLRGTRYLQIENPSAVQELSVYLYLPAGRHQVLTIAPGSHEQGLLGSDFSYSDLRFRLPVHDCAYRFLGGELLGHWPVWKVEAVRSGEDLSWRRAILYFSQDRPFLLGADYYGGRDAGPRILLKSMRVEKFRDVGSVRTAVCMTMSTRGGNRTTIVLQDIRFGATSVPEGWLVPSSLASPVWDQGSVLRNSGTASK